MRAAAPIPDESWHRISQVYLMEGVQYVNALLLKANGEALAAEPIAPISPKLTPAATLDQLCQIFELSGFERDVILLSVGLEMNGAIGALCGAVQGDAQRSFPTFSLALLLFPDAHWYSLSQDAPLRRWRLLDLSGGLTLTGSALRLDERILHFLFGVQQVDSRLAGIVSPWRDRGIAIPASQGLMVEQIAAILGGAGDAPLVQLCGGDTAVKQAIAAAACRKLGLGLLVVAADGLSTDVAQANLLQCLCEREARLLKSVVLIDCDGVPEGGPTDGAVAQLQSAIGRLIESIEGPVLVSSIDRRRQRQRQMITFEVQLPNQVEQRQLWLQGLTGLSMFKGEGLQDQLTQQIDRMVSSFNLSSPGIQSACARVEQLLKAESMVDSAIGIGVNDRLPMLLWDACLAQARPRLNELAQPIESGVGWEDLVLPEKEFLVLRTIAAHVRQRMKVYEQWGFAGKGGRGLGISALFSGASGTGKTLAAEVLAKELQLDLYRVDLSSVVSKYIGETEKNLRRIFDAAETGGTILLFDEADALFGKRSEVRDSHDRYANMEVAYLLQRIEAYRGLAIMTTNLKGSVDQAFLRRIRFIVQFPFPDVVQRTEIWRRVFPRETPVEGLVYGKLAKLSVAGGNIRNIALNAAFLAADAGESVQMRHILDAAQSEYVKLERPLTEAEVRGWVPRSVEG